MQEIIHFLDDIFGTGSNGEKHLKYLEEVFKRLNLKTYIFVSKIKYLGQFVDGKCLHKDLEKVKAIVEAPRPKKKSNHL